MALMKKAKNKIASKRDIEIKIEKGSDYPTRITFI